MDGVNPMDSRRYRQVGVRIFDGGAGRWMGDRGSKTMPV